MEFPVTVFRCVRVNMSKHILELSRILGVSDQTVRRVSQPLVESGRLTKVHGALVSNRIASDPPFLARMSLNRDNKVAIARKAVEIIKDESSIAIDTGSTSGYIALAPMAGTQLRDHDGAAFDRSAFDVIERMQVDYALLSASRVDPDKGFLVHEQCEVDIANAMFEIASQTIMAVDHSKFEIVNHLQDSMIYSKESIGA